MTKHLGMWANKKINSILLSTFIIISMGCDQAASNYVRNLPKPIPTKKELGYIQTLKSRGYVDIKLDIPNIGELKKGTQSYVVKIGCPLVLTSQNADSIVQLADEIANELYSSVIEDSIIYDCKEIYIQFRVKDSEIKNYLPILWNQFSKKQLEGKNKFKVIEVSPGEFKRIKLK